MKRGAAKGANGQRASVTAKKLIAIKYEQKLAGSGWRDAFARSFPFGALKNNKTTQNTVEPVIYPAAAERADARSPPRRSEPVCECASAHTYTHVRVRGRKVRDVNAREIGALDVSRNTRIRIWGYVCMCGEGGLSVLASSGHHRRRTVGMVGNDPVMTLTPRL